MAAIPGIVDAHLQQEVNAPAFEADIDRVPRCRSSVSDASTIANNINISLGSSEQVAPNFSTDPKLRHSLLPGRANACKPDVSSINDLNNTPVSTSLAGGGGGKVRSRVLLSNVATLKRTSVPTNANEANIQPTYDVYASVQDRDLGTVANDINKVVADLQKQLAPGNTIQVVRSDPKHA